MIPVSTPAVALLLQLPGPDRKRKPSPYCFRLVYRNPHTREAGCLATWEVVGGREPYQIVLELTAHRELRWHCTCADAVFRADSSRNYRCKHVRGLLSGVEAVAIPVEQQVESRFEDRVEPRHAA